MAVTDRTSPHRIPAVNGREREAVAILARAMLDAGKYAEARTLLAGLAAVDGGDNFTRRNLVLAMLRLGEYADAEPLAHSLAAEAGGDDLPVALFFLAHAQWGSGKTAAARQTVERYRQALQAAKTAAPQEGKTPRHV